MHLNTVKISSKGQIVLPKKVRELFNTDTVCLSINEQNQLVITPTCNLAGSLSNYAIDHKTSFDHVREESWNKSVLYERFNNKD